jgi:hypothetical protein
MSSRRTDEPAASPAVVEGFLRPAAGAPHGAREFDYFCPHCRTVTRVGGRNYDLLTFHRRGGALEDFKPPDAFAPFAGPVFDLVRLSVGDDFLAFRCTGCAAPAVAVISREALTHAQSLYHVERVFELRSWPPA